jgi:hypothetical protein
LLAASCASYPSEAARALDDLRGGRFEAAATALEDTPGFLGPAGAGAVRLAAGDWAGAQESLLEAAEVVDGLDREGLLEPAAVIEDLGALLVNERVNSYRGEGFERVQVHAMLALAFLAQGRLESVGVEVRRANQLLEREEELYETQYAAGGLGHFLSALSYELRGDLDDALIDYRRMDEKDLAPTLVGPELVRLARRLRREDLLPELEERYGEPEPVPEGHARVILIAGVGLAPEKFEASLAVPTGAGVVALAVPGYRARPQPVKALELELAELDLDVRSVVVEDLGAIAERNLDDRLGLLALRSGARAASRTVVSKQLRDSDQYLAAFAVDMFSIFAERADLRSWLTLPDTWQVAQAWIPAGVHGLSVEAVGVRSAELGRYELLPGETLIVFARTVDRSLFAHVLGGAAVDPEPLAPGVLQSGSPPL